MNSDSKLDRRDFLRAAGVALVLPRLESTGRVSPEAAPRRLAVLFMPNGVHVPSWKPKGRGETYRFSPTLAPMSPHRDRLLIASGLQNRNAFEGEGHYVKTTSLLSGAKVHRTGGRDVRCGTTIDQVAAQALGRATPIPSLVLGTEPVRNVVDMGYSTVYGAHISWRSAERPVPKEIEPRLVFDRIARGSTAGRRPRDRRVVDLVLDEARSLRRRVSGRDRAKLDEYLEAVHALEARIENFGHGRRGDRDALARGASELDLDPRAFPERAQLLIDLIVLAFRADVSRIATFMFGNAVSGRNFSFLDGVSGGFHPLSHHEKKPEKMRQYALINRWHVEQFAHLVSELRATRDEEGRDLLSSSAVMFCSGLSDGNSHNPRNLPIAIAGELGGALRTGRHLVSRRDRRLCSLHLGLLQGMGLKIQNFGDSNAVLPGLMT
jgi:uncharacterized protein DUF1552